MITQNVLFIFLKLGENEQKSLIINKMQNYTKVFFASLVIAAIASHFRFYSAATEQIFVNELDLSCGFTQDFTAFLQSKGYFSWGFDRPDITCGAFGGKSSPKDTISKTPIIFIHGNSDVGFGKGSSGYQSWQTGFRYLATYLGSQGYRKAELYTTTWGSASPSAASLNSHSKKHVTYLRAFVEAVLTYTNASQVTLIGHSMGVTLGRKIAQGGAAYDISGNYQVGPSLKSKIKSFVGVAGGNLGLTACYGQYLLPTCSEIDGFNPGATAFSNPSKYLHALNSNSGGQSKNIYSVWSKYDEVVGGACIVWGKVTSRIVGQADQVVKNTASWGHFELRDKTGPDIIQWL